MVKIERGKTIFDSNAQTLVNTINCVGVMGKGLALEMKKRYPNMFDKYKDYCDKGLIDIGKLWLYKHSDEKWNAADQCPWAPPQQCKYYD